MAAEYKLSITPVKITDLPPADALLAQGRAILEDTAHWKAGKTFYKSVRTFSRARGAGDGAAWHCRVSEHAPADAEGASFDALWAKLSVNKGENEVHYVEEVKKAACVRRVSPREAVWTMFYRFPPPVTPRVFTVLQVVDLSGEVGSREGIIVSIPVDLSPDPELAAKEEKGTHGHYSSVERVKEIEGGKVEWRMATTSSPGGHIPQFITERSIPSSIARDVPGLLKWLKESKDKPADEAPAATAEVHAAAEMAQTAPQGEAGGPGAAGTAA